MYHIIWARSYRMILYKALVDLLWCFSLIYVTRKTSSIFYKYTSNNVFVSDTKYWQGIYRKAKYPIIPCHKLYLIRINPVTSLCTWFVSIELFLYCTTIELYNASIQIWKDVSIEWIFNEWLFILHYAYTSENAL